MTRPLWRTVASRRPRGFTLIELLVVIGVIMILASIAMPTLVRAQRHALATSCKSNLRQLAQGLFVYARDSDLFLPCRRTGSVSDDDLSALFPAYIGDINCFRCPASIYDFPTTGEHIRYKTSLRGSYGDQAQLSYEYPGECVLSLNRDVDSRYAVFPYDDDGRGRNVVTDVDAHSPSGGNMSFVDGRVDWVQSGDWWYGVWDGIYGWFDPPRRASRPGD